jgi:hypothetical protein
MHKKIGASIRQNETPLLKVRKNRIDRWRSTYPVRQYKYTIIFSIAQSFLAAQFLSPTPFPSDP